MVNSWDRESYHGGFLPPLAAQQLKESHAELLIALSNLISWADASGIQCLPADMEKQGRLAIANATGDKK